MRNVVAALAVVAASAPAFADDDPEGEPKISLPTEADRVAWQHSGFRLGIGFVYGQFRGIGGPPNGRILGTELHVGLRLDPSWSIMSTFQYAGASADGGLAALRFAGTIDPTWHVTPSFSVAIGFGFGGLVESRTTRPDVDPLPSTLDTSYTFPDAHMPLPACSGVGAAGLARAAYTVVLGAKTALELQADVIGQYTACEEDTKRVDPDTAEPIVRKQYWPHVGATLSLGVTWR